jgi:hypothetical protein
MAGSFSFQKEERMDRKLLLETLRMLAPQPDATRSLKAQEQITDWAQAEVDKLRTSLVGLRDAIKDDAEKWGGLYKETVEYLDVVLVRLDSLLDRRLPPGE